MSEILTSIDVRSFLREKEVAFYEALMMYGDYIGLGFSKTLSQNGNYSFFDGNRLCEDATTALFVGLRERFRGQIKLGGAKTILSRWGAVMEHTWLRFQVEGENNMFFVDPTNKQLPKCVGRMVIDYKKNEGLYIPIFGFPINQTGMIISKIKKYPCIYDPNFTLD